MFSSSSLAYNRSSDGGGEPRSIWLIASVAANLIFVGLIVAWVIDMPSHRFLDQRQDLIASLSPADAAVMRDNIPRLDASKHRASSLYAAQNAKMMTLLRADTFDRAAFEALMNGTTAIRDAQEAETFPIFVNEIASLTPDGRHKVANFLEKYGPGGSNEQKR